MSDSQKSSSSTTTITNTTEVLARVEGFCEKTGRPRAIRLFYPEDGYSQGQDTRKRKHMLVECQAKDVAQIAKS